ncbi:MAG: 30S ribosomal protein S17 [Xanthomonadaceae bacterium]|nr:30S ribosomal protein S17 [Xanthomonadaceae bacterium]
MVAKKETKAAPKAKVVKAPKAPHTPKAAQAVKGQVVQLRREMIGVVVSNKMQKTIVVKIDRQVKHGLYKKYLTKSNKYKAHDETNVAKVGDLVSIVESRPLSREKRWALQKIVRKSTALIAAVEV